MKRTGHRGVSAPADRNPVASAWTVRRILLLGLTPLVVLILLAWTEVPLGQPDYLVYRYSQWRLVRLMRACVPALIGAGMIWSLHRSRLDRGSLASWVCVAGTAALAAWTWFAPPQPVSQHMFNLNSPSHDGAFIWEAEEVGDPRTYVSAVFYERLRLDVARMRGTRVLSNPPGATLLAWACQRLIRDHPRWRDFADRILNWGDAAPDSAPQAGSSANPASRDAGDPEEAWPEDFRTAVLFSLVLTLLWALSWPLGYAVARLYLPPAAALVIGTACAWNPATLNFTPGKDPAQGLTTLMIVYPALRGFLRGSGAWSCLSGAALIAGLTLGLVHAWVALILAAGTGLCAWRSRGAGRWFKINLLPACVGAGLSVAALYALTGWNLPRTCVAVTLRYPQIQVHLREGGYTFVGFPVFLLFAGPTFWVLAATAMRVMTADRGRRCVAGASTEMSDVAAAAGRWIMLAAAPCLMYCYFFANNNEIARLWMPFLTLLTVSLSMMLRDRLGSPNETDVATLRSADAPSDRSVRPVLLLLLALQLGVTLMHWSLMDAREAEWRLSTGVNWG
ncbi:MAG: hypothetical protein FLDDKLPJ_00825 [Phycisphaerae bacterium]|nr:hypothetical protein [Phycisphaerae bacterium]